MGESLQSILTFYEETNYDYRDDGYDWALLVSGFVTWPYLNVSATMSRVEGPAWSARLGWALALWNRMTGVSSTDTDVARFADS